MTYVPPAMNEKEQPRSYSEQISRIPSGWEDNRWRRLCVILDAVDDRLNRLEKAGGRFQLTAERLAEIESDLDDDSGFLIKSSTLKSVIEREVRRALGQSD